MFGLAAVLFFSVTGVTLNHPDWFFADAQHREESEGRLEASWLAPGPDVNRLAIVERLRASHGVRGALADFTVDDRECVLTFKGPGYAADVFINRRTSEYELTQTSHGLVAVLNDLHKGRDTGPVWSVLIDVVAVLMTVVSLTGLILLFYLKLRRVPGTVLIILGTLATLAVVYYGVP